VWHGRLFRLMTICKVNIMVINRRRAPTREISREKKLSGHLREGDYATLIDGETISGTQKGDVKDKKGNLYSVKSGKKWQVFLYGHKRISNSQYLKVLQPCIEAFTEDVNQYFEDRIKCIAYKEAYLAEHGRIKAKLLSNEELSNALGPNVYVESKNRLALTTLNVSNALQDKVFLHNFLDEALFNKKEVQFLAVKDSTFKKDELFKVFAREEALKILTNKLFPETSGAGRVLVDFNVPGQKTLLRYKKTDFKNKNIVEIEIRNDRDEKYRHVRFNMLSKDALSLLLEGTQTTPFKELCNGVLVYGEAIELMGL